MVAVALVVVIYEGYRAHSVCVRCIGTRRASKDEKTVEDNQKLDVLGERAQQTFLSTYFHGEVAQVLDKTLRLSGSRVVAVASRKLSCSLVSIVLFCLTG